MGFLAAAYEKGVKIGRKPGDHLRLASNDDHPMSRFTCPALTTSAHDYSGVSNLTVQTFINRLDQGGPLVSVHRFACPPDLFYATLLKIYRVQNNYWLDFNFRAFWIRDLNKNNNRHR